MFLSSRTPRVSCRLVWSTMVCLGVCIGATPKKPLWSLQPVVAPQVPSGLVTSRNPIDAFIAEKYREKGAARPVRPTSSQFYAASTSI